MRSDLKILVISKQFPPTIGGGGAHTDYLVHELARTDGVQVHVLTAHSKGLPYEEERLRGKLIVHRCSFKHTEGLPYEPAIEKGLELCKAVRPNVIHSQHLDGGFVGLHLKASCKIPLVVTIHKTPSLGYDDSVPERNPTYSALKLLFATPSVDIFIAGSKVFEKELLSVGAPSDKIRFVYHGVPIEKLKRLAFGVKKTQRLQARLDLDEGSEIILCPSRLDERKELEVLVQATSILQSQYPRKRIVLLITGEPTNEHSYKYKLKLEETAARSNFQGDLKFQNFPFELMPALYKTARVCVLPSRKEGLGLVLLEALSIGCPSIASNSPGIIEVITSDKNGLLFEPGDPTDLTRQLKRLFENEELVRSLRKEGFRTVREKFHSRSMAEGHLQIYASLI